MMKIAAIVFFLMEIFLSHQNGKESGDQSRWISEKTGVNESIIRSSAHVFMFLLLTVMMMQAFGRPGLIVTAAWAVIDEITKPLLHNQRHCAIKDILLNILGVATGSIFLIRGM